MNDCLEPRLERDQVLSLLKALPGWGNTTTIVFSHGCVFEYKGNFPAGQLAEGYYNLDGPTTGFHGHLRLDALAQVRFQDKPHRGRASYAFVFLDESGNTVFKLFLGRGKDGEVLPHQLQEFQRIRTTLTIGETPNEK
ncbi:MAG: heme utilization cystosolic carrier protein HutX [Gammaproteobacteria bacterium]|nr:heme utilization cystosolic carrier protein HutX [Gammaproteobacteria bacterium]